MITLLMIINQNFVRFFGLWQNLLIDCTLVWIFNDLFRLTYVII